MVDEPGATDRRAAWPRPSFPAWFAATAIGILIAVLWRDTQAGAGRMGVLIGAGALAGAWLLAILVSFPLARLSFALLRAKPATARVVAALGAAWPWALGLDHVIADCLSGPRIAASPWHLPLSTFGRLAAWVLTWYAACRVMQWIEFLGERRSMRSGGPVVAVVLTAAAAAVACSVVDGTVLPRHYPAAHLFLCVAMVLAAALATSPLVMLFRGSVGNLLAVTIAGGAVVATLAVFSERVPGADATLRRAMLVDAPTLRRVLPLLVGDGRSPSAAGPIDESLVRALSERPRVEAAVLERVWPERRRFGFVLITVDTLRADRIGAYGYGRPTTPAIDAFAARATLFENAWAQHPSSRLSMASFLRGLQPTGTDVWTGMQERAADTGASIDPVLPGLMAAAGRRTVGITSLLQHFYTSQMPYVAQGFETFKNLPLQDDRSAEAVTDAAIVALEKADERPVFLWAHYFNPHEPYTRHAGHDFGAAPEDVYDGEIALADRHVGRLLEAVDRRLDPQRTVVVIHSDHGEELGERGGRGHHSSLYEEQIRVPLVVRAPGIAARRVTDPVGLVDLLPTCVELLDLESPPKLHGRSLVSLLLPEGVAPRTPPPVVMAMFRDSRFGGGRLDALRAGPLKLVQDLTTGVSELYDLDSDPGERRDLAFDHPERLGPMLALLDAERARLAGRTDRATAGASPGVVLDPDLEAGLASSEPTRVLAAIRAAADLGRFDLLSARLEDLLASSSAAVRSTALHAVAASRDVVPRALVERALDDATLSVAVAAARALALLGDPAAIPALQRVATTRSAPPGGPFAAATCALAMLGDGDAAARLVELEPGLRGGDRLFACLAAAKLRIPGARRRLAAALLFGALDDPEAAAAIKILSTPTADAETLVALYVREHLTSMRAGERAAVIDALAGAGAAAAAPFLRHYSSHPDPKLRRVAESILAEESKSSWLEPMRRASRDLVSAEQVGRGLGQWIEARDLCYRAWDIGRAAGYHDWGAVFEAWQYALAAGDPYAVATRLRDIAADAEAAAPEAQALLRRLADVAASCATKTEVTFSVESADADLPGDMAEPWMIHVKIGVLPNFGGVPGGLPFWSPCVAVRFTRDGESAGSDALFSLPPLGLLPGESVDMLLPVTVPQTPAGTLRAEIAFFYRDWFLHGPIGIERQTRRSD